MPDTLASRVRLAARAVRLKWRLLTAFDTLGPAAVRGGKLLARGRVREFARKLFNELPDARDLDSAPVRSGPPLFLAGHVLSPGGYDYLVLAVLKELTAAGVNVQRDARACFRKHLVPPELRPGESRRRRDDARLAVCPPHLLKRYRPDRRTAAFTMWETDTLPADAVRHLNRCGLVIVPSKWGADCFRANGVTVPIEVVPLGYEPTWFGRTPNVSEGVGLKDNPVTDVPGSPRTIPVVFGTAGDLTEGGLRKNVQRVIDLFRRAFPADPTVRLRVKISPKSPPVDTHGDPRIEVTARHLTPEELADWYRSLTAFVNGSFGEGFGLHLLEAMACGRPLISTRFSGVGEFFDAAVGYEVGYRLVEARNAVYSGRWADPDDGELIARMQQAAANPADAHRLGERAAERAAQFTWAETTRKLLAVLEQYRFTSPPV